MNRREFLHFLGTTGVVASLPLDLQAVPVKKPLSIPSLAPSLEDKLVTIEGLEYNLLLRWGDKINATQTFGYNNDFIAFHPLAPDRGILWVNHEYVSPLFLNGEKRTKENVDLEMKEVGGSLVEVKKVNENWVVVTDSTYNRRLDANTEIPFAWPHEIKASKKAIGTIANCAGGYTPWGTILTCEENYNAFWGDRFRDGSTTKSWLQWDKFYPRSPEHYGWVVEVEPKTGKAKKLISLGRCAHECAAINKSKAGKIVAYTGDDAVNEHLYKFISDSGDSLERGKLYVANLEKGEWISLSIDDQPLLKSKFKDQTEVLIYTREAAKLLGATPLDRPEDIEFDPLTGNVLVALTNNKTKGNYHGSILKIIENDNDYGSLKFKSETFLSGGSKQGFACPDNMVFDRKGNLWFTTDISGREINKGEYKGLGNNGLFVFLRNGPHAGKIIRAASAPRDAEFTGPCFSPDYKTLFLSVQHPGEESTSKEKTTSNWPDGGLPKSAVVTLHGSFLDKIIEGKL